MAVYEPALRGWRPREGVPNLRRGLRLHAHLLHEFVEEVLSFRVGIGLESAIEILEKPRDFLEVQGREVQLIELSR